MGVFEGKVANVADMERGVAVAALLGSGARQLDLRLFHFDAVQLTPVHRPGQADGDGAGSD